MVSSARVSPRMLYPLHPCSRQLAMTLSRTSLSSTQLTAAEVAKHIVIAGGGVIAGDATLPDAHRAVRDALAAARRVTGPLNHRLPNPLTRSRCVCQNHIATPDCRIPTC